MDYISEKRNTDFIENVLGNAVTYSYATSRCKCATKHLSVMETYRSKRLKESTSYSVHPDWRSVLPTLCI
jgi:hypothetical protein